MIYIGQRFMTVPKDVRSNANFIIGFTQPKDDSDCFYNNVLSRFIDKGEFKRLISEQWKQYEDGHSDYIAVNLETGIIYTDFSNKNRMKLSILKQNMQVKNKLNEVMNETKVLKQLSDLENN